MSLEQRISPLLKRLRTLRRQKRIEENERLRVALDSTCPVFSWRYRDDRYRRACKDGERDLCDVLDCAMRGVERVQGEDEGESEGMFPC